MGRRRQHAPYEFPRPPPLNRSPPFSTVHQDGSPRGQHDDVADQPHELVLGHDLRGKACQGMPRHHRVGSRTVGRRSGVEDGRNPSRRRSRRLCSTAIRSADATGDWEYLVVFARFGVSRDDSPAGV